MSSTTREGKLSNSERRRLLRIAQTLSSTYDDPRLGNKDDPLDELFYIILSAKTPESSFSRTYEALRSQFRDWFVILRSPPGTVASLIQLGGLSRKKEAQIRGLLHALDDWDAKNLRAALEPLDDASAEELLCQLPGVGLKTARCVLVYSLGRSVFPVDAHTNRVLTRLGFTRGGRITNLVQDELQAIVPPKMRYSLHVNLVAHGRATCLAGLPACERCVVASDCPRFRLPNSRQNSASTKAGK